MSNPPVTPTLQATASRPREQYQDSDSQASYHLCAGVYVDRSFRDLVIRKIHNNSQRRVAPSYGFDLVPVVRHVWRSWYLDPGFRGPLSDALVLGSRLAVALVVCVIFVCLMVCVTARIIAETFRAQVAAVVEGLVRATQVPDTSGDSRAAVDDYSSTRIPRFCVQLPLEKFLGSNQRRNLILEVWL